MNTARCLRALGTAVLLLPGLALAFDYPTKDRVEYVLQCMQEKPDKPAFEMVSKCSCALDEMRKKLPYKKYVEMLTAVNGITIAGDRSLRDSEQSQKDALRFRELQAKANKSCYIN
jgi:hypothetical protein